MRMPERPVRWLIAVAATLLVTAGLQLQAAPPAAADPTADPASVDFGTVPLNTTVTRTITLSIDDGYALEGAAGSGLVGPFDLDRDTCGGPNNLGPGTCTVKESFTPTTAGPTAGYLQISECPATSTGACLWVIINLSGSGSYALAANPTSVDFGTVRLGTTATRNIDFTVDAGYKLNVASISVGGTGNPYSNFSFGTCSGFSGPGTCTASIDYTPTGNGTSPVGTLRMDECRVNDASSCAPSVAVFLSGGGGSPKVTLDHASLTYADQGVSIASDPQTVKVTNSGTLPLQVGTLSASGDYSLASDSCSGQSIAAGAFCTVGVVFKPTAPGDRTGTLSIPDDAGDSPQQVDLDGTGVVPTATFTPSSITFASRLVGSTSPVRTVTLVNTSSVGMLFRKQSITGDFAIVPGGTCVVGTVVDAGDPCTVNVRFSPTDDGTRDGALVLNTTAASSPHVLPLSGDAFYGTPGFSATPTSLAFGNQAVGTTSSGSTVTVTNPGTGTLSLQNIGVSGNFARAGGSCGSSLPAGGSCTVTVTFTPTATGSRNGALTFTDNASTSPQQVALHGTGVAPAVTLSSSSLAFPSTRVGSTSPTRTETVKNTGTAPLNFLGFTMTGNFALRSSGTCHVGTAVAAGSSCTLVMVFTPNAKGTRTGSLSISDNAPGSPRHVSLSGTGT